MIIETSTLNVLLVGIFGLQAWMLREVVALKTRVAAIQQRLRDKDDEDRA